LDRCADKVVLITNGINPDLFSGGSTGDHPGERMKDLAIPDSGFVCMYLGAHSLYNALDTVIEAATALREESGIHFVLIGGGDKKEDLMKDVVSRGLTNVHFLPPVPRLQAPRCLRSADIFLLPNLKGDFYKMNLQNKFFDYLASGKPVVFAGCGESADIIKRLDCGRIVDAEDGRAMAKAILDLRSMPKEKRLEMGKKAEDFVFSNYNREVLFDRLLKVLSPYAR